MAAVTETVMSLLKGQGAVLSDFNINPLYILPVVLVIVLCLLVYAFGFKSTSNALPASSLALLRDSPKVTKGQKNKPTATVPKNKTSNGLSNGNAVKPKAVVKPLKPEVKAKPIVEVPVVKPKQKKLKAEEVEPILESEIDDLEGGEWVTVVTKKDQKKKKPVEGQETEAPMKESPKKDSKKSKNKSAKKEEVKKAAPVKVDTVTANASPVQAEIVPVAVAPITPKQIISQEPSEPVELEDWTVEDPIEEKISKIPNKKSLKNKEKSLKSKEKILEKQLSREEELREVKQSVSVSEETLVVKEDKITKDILAQYDAPAVVKKEAPKKKKEAKKKKVESVEESHIENEPSKKKETSLPKETSPKEISPTKEVSPKKEKKKKIPVASAAEATTLPVSVEAVKPASGSSEVTDGKTRFEFCDSNLTCPI